MEICVSKFWLDKQSNNTKKIFNIGLDLLSLQDGRYTHFVFKKGNGKQMLIGLY